MTGCSDALLNCKHAAGAKIVRGGSDGRACARACSSIWTDGPRILQEEIKQTSEASVEPNMRKVKTAETELCVNMCDENRRVQNVV